MSRETAERVFNQALEANRAATEMVRQEIARLEQAPQKNEQEIKAAHDKLLNIREEKEQLDKKKQEFVDLSLDSLAADAGGGAMSGSAAPAAPVPPAADQAQ